MESLQEPGRIKKKTESTTNDGTEKDDGTGNHTLGRSNCMVVDWSNIFRNEVMQILENNSKRGRKEDKDTENEKHKLQ